MGYAADRADSVRAALSADIERTMADVRRTTGDLLRREFPEAVCPGGEP
jgi:hypothetical protein